METNGWRKLGAGLVVLGVGIAITVAKGDIPANLLQLLQVLFGAFVVGNVGEHIVGAVHARAATSVQVAQINADAAAAEPWQDNIDALQASLDKKFVEINDQFQAFRGDFGAVGTGLMTLAQKPDGSVAVEAKVKELCDLLTRAMAQPETAFDYAAAVGQMMSSLEKIQEAQQINSKALALIIQNSN